MRRKDLIARAVLMVMLSATALLAQAIGLATGTNADQQTRQVVRIGSITLYVPPDWLSSTSVTVVLEGGDMVNESSDEDYLAESVAIWGHNLDTLLYIGRVQLPFQIGILTANPRTLEWEKKKESERIAEAWARGDSARSWGDGVLEIQPGLYLLIGSESAYRLEQPLIV